MSEAQEFPEQKYIGGLDDLKFCPPPFLAHEIYGHDAVIAQFMQQFKNNTLHHAWLLAGEQGIGKASLAYHLAAKVLGENEVVNAHANLYVVQRGHSETGTVQSNIPVETIRKLTHFLQQTAANSGWRVVIIDSIDAFNRNATNALLKSLEEPPAKTLFFIICHNAGKLLPTIRSRVLLQKLIPLQNDTLLLALKQALGHISEDQIPFILQQVNGNVRQACILAQGQSAQLIAQIESELSCKTWPQPHSFALIAQLAEKANVLQWDLAKTHILSMLNNALMLNAHAKIEHLHAISQQYSALETQFAEAEEFNLDKQAVLFSVLEKARAVLV